MAAIHGPSTPEASKTLHQILFVPTKGGNSRDLSMSCVVHLARVSCRARYHQALRLVSIYKIVLTTLHIPCWLGSLLAEAADVFTFSVP